MTKIDTVLLDLDGTLADTAPDMAHALNLLLRERNHEPLPFDLIRPHVSHGALALVRLGFALAPDSENLEPLRRRYLEIYADNLCRETHLFPGIPQLLDALNGRGMRWGVVTNKPAHLTEPLIGQLALRYEPACIISGDTTNNRKPHPEPLLHACAQAGSAPQRALFVGDAERDIQAGQQARMRTLVALFGYIGREENPQLWGADGVIHAPMEICDWLDAHG